MGLQTPERTALHLELGCYSNQSLHLRGKVITPPLAGISGLDGGFHIPQSCSLFSDRAASKPGQPERQHFPQLLPLNDELFFQVLSSALWAGVPDLPRPRCGHRGNGLAFDL